MYRKLILAAAMTAAFSAPAFAEWNVLKPLPTAKSSDEVCMVVDRGAATAGEMKIAGPFKTQEQANAALATAVACARPAK